MSDPAVALVDSSSDRGQQARAKKTLSLRQQQARADLRALLNLPAGRRVLWRILEQGEIFSTVFTSDLATMARFLGHRDIGVWLLSELEQAEPSALVRLKQDARSANAEEAAQADRTPATTTEEDDHDG